MLQAQPYPKSICNPGLSSALPLALALALTQSLTHTVWTRSAPIHSKKGKKGRSFAWLPGTRRMGWREVSWVQRQGQPHLKKGLNAHTGR